MSLASIFNQQKQDLKPTKEELAELSHDLKMVSALLRTSLRRERVIGNVFVGGSFAKKTLIKKTPRDVDLFIRLKKIDSGTMARLERAVQNVSRASGYALKKVHGSRDYFQLSRALNLFEIIPVLAITRPAQAQNVTDLSYFHVSYVKRHLNKKMADEVLIAKQFCQVQGVYGAESYIRGFSGYGLECLMIYYKSLRSLLNAVARAHDTIILDPARHYKNNVEARLSLNEAKRQSPIILVDPTYRERNVLAALSRESFVAFQKAARAFLARPSASFFIERKFDETRFIQKARKQGKDALKIELHTDRQAGDIAGTKLKKVASYIVERLSETYAVGASHFIYEEGQEARFIFAYTMKKTLERRGPLISMKSACSAFKKHHPHAFVRKGRLWAHIQNSEPIEQVVRKITQHHEQMYNMGLTEANVEKI